MAQYVLPFTATIPANTAKAAPFTQAINLDGWTLQRLDLEVPTGPAGLMGFQIYNNGVAWIPYGAGAWIVWDNARASYYLEDQPNAGGWAIVGYNLGTFAHTVTVRAHVTAATSGPTPPSSQTVTIVTSGTATGDTVTLD